MIVMAPIPVVTGDIGERMMSDPYVTVTGYVAPGPDTVRDVIGNYGRTPIVTSVHIDPVSIFVEVVCSDRGGI
jgi:hypothetical protein